MRQWHSFPRELAEPPVNVHCERVRNARVERESRPHRRPYSPYCSPHCALLYNYLTGSAVLANNLFYNG